MSFRHWSTLSLVSAGALALGAGWHADRAEARVTGPSTPAAPAALDTGLARSYRWRALGPDRGGRSIAATGVRGRPNEAYFGATGGGLWKTTDSGTTWNPVTDGQINSASVGAVAVSETNPDIVWIGMGETCIRGNIMPGDGVYKSTDGGKTWAHVGFASSENIAKIRIDPLNPDIVYVAAFGKMSAPNADRGVYKTTDGGKTWKKVLYRDDKTGAIDISIDRTDSRVLYAAMWEAFRNDYTMSSGGPGSGLFKSTDAGETWTEITRAPGMPQGMIGRIGVSVSGANPNRVYALVENENGGLFRSDDAGHTWALINDSRNIRQRAFYYTHLSADPRNQDMVYMQNTSLFRSTDGGKTMQAIGGSHGDKHDLWIDPDNSHHIVEGNDGGGTVTFNNGESWSDEDYPTEQFYHVITTAHVPYHVCGSQQDNSTLCIPSDWNLASAGFGGRGGRGRGGAGAAIPRNDAQMAAGGMAQAYVAGGGEPGYIAADPNDPDVFYSGTNNGSYINKINRRTGYSREVNPYPWFYSGEPSSAIPERWQWTFPIIFSKADSKLLFTSSQRLWKTHDGGRTWTAISGDLTRHDPKTMGVSGGPITGDMNGPEVYAVIFSVAPGKRNTNVVWTGSDDGLLNVTKDGGKTWTNVTPKDLPEFSRVSQIDASQFDDGTAYFTARRMLMDDKTPYVYRTHDFGKTWTKIVSGIRGDDWMHSIREDPTRKGLLYAAGQHGMYISYNDGDTWESLRLNMPDVPVSDIIVEANDLVISTHGRGFYVLDHIGPLRQYNAEVAAAQDAWLFAPPQAMRSGTGASFTYWLKKPASRVTIDVLDSANNVVRSFAPPATNAGGRGGRGGGRGGFVPTTTNTLGLNHFTWDLRYEPAVSFPGMIFWGASTTGPAAPPGTYKVRLNADAYSQTQSFKVVRNPAFTDVSDADLRAQFDFAMKIRAKVNEANQAVIDARRVKTDAADRMKQNSDAQIKRAGDKLTTNVSDVEDDIYQVKNQSGQDPLNFPIRINNRMANLMSMVEDGDGAPLSEWPALFKRYSDLLKVQTDRMSTVYASDLTAFNNELKRLGLPIVAPPCPAGQTCTVVP